MMSLDDQDDQWVRRGERVNHVEESVSHSLGLPFPLIIIAQLPQSLAVTRLKPWSATLSTFFHSKLSMQRWFSL